MSAPSDYTLFVKIDDTQLQRQMKAWENMFTRAQQRFEKILSSPAAQRVAVLSGASNSTSGNVDRVGEQVRKLNGLMAASQNTQLQMMSQSASVFGRIEQTLGSLSKSSLAMVGVGAGIAGLTALIVESSPMLKSMVRLMQTSVTLILRPIGDFIGSILRPLMISFFTKFVLPYSKFMDQLGTGTGKKLAEFLGKDWDKVIAGMAAGLGAKAATDYQGPPAPSSSSNNSPGPGSSPGSLSGCIELCSKTIDSLNNGISQGIGEKLKNVLPLVAGAGGVKP
jgi:hypothetical protein